MANWKFIETAEAERDGWLVDEGNGMLLGKNDDGTLTCVQVEWGGTWMVCEYAADLECLNERFGLDTETVEGIVGDIELMARCVTLKHLELVPAEETVYLDDEEIIEMHDEYDGHLTDEHRKILDACAEVAPRNFDAPHFAEEEARYRIAAHAVECAGLAGTFMVCAW